MNSLPGLRGWGRSNDRRTEEEGTEMQEAAPPVESRRESLLNQLENPGLTRAEIDKIKLKLEVLDAQEA